MEIKAIHINGRRWFDRSAGNTYCSFQILVNGEIFLAEGYQYGYDDHYRDLAMEALAELGLIDAEHTHAPWSQLLERTGIVFTTTVCDGLKRELFDNRGPYWDNIDTGE